MLTDLRLRKYLDGELSLNEAKEVELLLEKNPELKSRLETLRTDAETIVGRLRCRRHLGHETRRGSRIRYTTILPALLLLLLVLGVTSHWFVRPGSNSTFTIQGGTGNAIELLYSSPKGWRYFDAGFKPGDSLSITIRDNKPHYVKVMGVEAFGTNARLLPLWASDSSNLLAAKAIKPVFTSLPPKYSTPLAILHYVIFYGPEPLPEFLPEEASDILQGVMAQRDAETWKFQVFSVKPLAKH